jgi:uncharacterized protein (TIGR03435 family)
MRLSIVWLVLMTATRLAQAQTQPRPKFDVSVVKLMDLRLGASGLQAQYQTPLWVFSCKDGHFVSTGPPLKNVIRAAYRARWQFSVPDWADMAGTRYYIEGKADLPLSEEDCWLATQSLLEERFKLKIHRETKEVAAYALVLAKGGAKLREGTPDAPSDGVWLRGQRYSTARWSSYVIAVRLADLPEIGRPVVDQTGLKGQYEFRLDYAARPEEDKPDIFTALQQQLGLKLEPTKTTSEFIVIDGIERPSEN